MKKILLTGVQGQVGHALQQSLTQLEVIGTNSAQMDLSDPDAIRRVVQTVKPDLIINPAAYTAVDKAETDVALATAVNAIAPRVLAEEAAKLGAAMIHFSTDYVYDGNKTGHYVETDPVNPVNVYGRTKLAGEDGIRQVGLPHLIFRTSWVYGSFGKNFLKTILRLATERSTLSIVGDQWGAPTSDLSIAQTVSKLLPLWDTTNANLSGVYHLVNAGETSWYGFACAIVDEYRRLQPEKCWPQLSVQTIAAIRADAYPTPAKRPMNSRLSTEKIHAQFGIQMSDWQQALLSVMPTLQIAPVGVAAGSQV